MRGRCSWALLVGTAAACSTPSPAHVDATDTEETGTASDPGDDPTLATVDRDPSTGDAPRRPEDDESSGSDGPPADASTGTSSDTGGDTGTTAVQCDTAQSPVFTNVTVAAGVDFVHGTLHSPPNCLVDSLLSVGTVCLPERMTGGAAVGDYDGDGWRDLLVTRLEGSPLLFHNDHDGTFSEVASAVGIDVPAPSAGAAWADIDNDDDLDLYVLTMAGDRYYLYVNGGDGTFSEQAEARGLALDTGNIHLGTSVAVGDYDLDGWVDVYVGEWRDFAVVGDFPVHARLFHNLGSAAPGTFEDVTIDAGVDVQGLSASLDTRNGVFVFAPAFVDLDGDGLPELTLVSDFRHSRLFWNEGDGTFSDGTIAAGVGLDNAGMGSTFGDFDLDGDLDWFVASVADDLPDHANRLYENAGDRTFTDIAGAAGVADTGMAWGTSFADLDLDGDLDLLVANGFYSNGHLAETTHLFVNMGALPFVDATEAAQIGVTPDQGRGLVVFDYDLDGDQDVFIVNNAGHPELWRNEGMPGARWLRVETLGTSSNTGGLGAVVEVRASPDDAPRVQVVGATSTHFLGQSEPVAHFGLGCGTSEIAEVTVRWPRSGAQQTFYSVSANTTIVAIKPP